jgi:Ca2+-binding RTX toxin-like protein
VNADPTGGGGSGVFVFFEGNDTFGGTEFSDWILAGAGNDTISGGDFSDTIFGGAGNDVLSGQADDDFIVGGAGADTISGGAGTDNLSGGAGSDVYLFNLGDGQDFIDERVDSTDPSLQSGIGPVYMVGDGDTPLGTDVDTVRFGEGIAEADVWAHRAGDSLVLTVKSTGEYVHIANWFSNGVLPIERVQFSSGVTWTATQIRAKVLVPTDGNDFITGYLSGEKLTGGDGNDLIDGREGNDTIVGGAGADTLIGGAGRDRFVLDQLSEVSQPDVITDFQEGIDTIALSAAVFTTLGAVGTRVGLSDHLTYDSATGELAYDADGADGAAGTVIAIIGTTTHPGLVNPEFLIVA